MSSSKPHLMVSPYAPYRDGIATYAVQEVRSRVASGEQIEVLSPTPSAAHHHLALGNLAGVSALIKTADQFSGVTIQFYPELLFGLCRNRIERILVWRGLYRLAKLVPVEYRVHEITYSSFAKSATEKRAARAALREASKITVHTRAEAVDLVNTFDLDLSSVELLEHGKHFVPAANMTQAEAQEYLEIAPLSTTFLCIGFIQSHKGFDRAAAAMSQFDTSDSQLYMVGSNRVDVIELTSYADYLQSQADQIDGVHFRRQFVSDHDFDAWIIASDTVVLPYREIWSSGVLERAKLFGKKVIAIDTGGLADQSNDQTILVGSSAEMAEAMATAAGAQLNDNWEITMENAETEAQELADSIRQRAGTVGTRPVSAGRGSKRLRQMGMLRRPSADSPSQAKQKLKTTILRLINWQVDPVASYVSELQRSTLDAVNDLEERLEALEDSNR